MLKHSELLLLELRGQAQLLKTKLHSIIISPPNFTHYSQTSIILLATAESRLVPEIVRWRSTIHHCREHVSTALELSYHAKHYCISRFALYLVIYGLDVAAQP
ncbi:hypothetical protein GOODEAATRI_020425 [Goodea atripinnis]|uniref:Uncharacterized protein n=1 Tax=Goodea atripinnis TaxID=208336 RepID=A0ABV0PQH2_9TELE